MTTSRKWTPLYSGHLGQIHREVLLYIIIRTVQLMVSFQSREQTDSQADKSFFYRLTDPILSVYGENQPILRCRSIINDQK